MAIKITPVIMAGGSGTRLWPLSRKLFPKQFLPLVSDETMLQDTISRLDDSLIGDKLTFSDAIIVCNEEHRFIVAEQLRSAGQKARSIILEPIGRNTAPAVALAALEATTTDEDAMLLVLAADHLIKNEEVFLKSVSKAAEIAQSGAFSTFGIVPCAPETGYGYIEAGDISEGAGPVKKFVEKPDLATAQSYLDAGCFFWNSGMFMFSAKAYLEELSKFRPDILSAVTKAYEGKTQDLDFLRVDKASFEACPDDSIDYAIMEKTDKAMVVPMDAGWSDIGSWSSLWEQSEKDESGNVCHGDVLNLNSSNCLVHTTHKLVATVGVDDLMIVNTPDALLVSAKDQVQDVKKVVDALKKEGRGEALLHREVARPWGSYDSIDMGERFQVKRITVKPGGKLSLQMHHHRAEHWIVVSGSAKVTVGEETQLLSENQSTYIPIGVTHRLENPGVVPLEMIEVQSGSYLGEDDIVRFEDTYGRS